MGCSSTSFSAFCVLARRRSWPFCISVTDIPRLTRLGSRLLECCCVDRISGLIFYRVRLPVPFVVRSLDEPAFLHTTLRKALGFGFRPASTCTLTNLEKTAITAALYGYVQIAVIQTASGISAMCKFSGPHRALRKLRRALSGRFCCHICLAEHTVASCSRCRRSACAYCSFSLERDDVCLCCAFRSPLAMPAQRTPFQCVQYRWYFA